MSTQSGTIAAPLPRRASHGGLRALRGIVWRELEGAVWNYRGLVAAVAWPLLWLVVFAAGVQTIFGAITIDAYQGAYKPYQEYVIPGLVGMVLLFGAMRFAVDLVRGREGGEVRMLLTAPLARPWLLFCKLVGGALVLALQAYLFLAAAAVLAFILPGIDVPWGGWLAALPAVLLGGFMLASIAVSVAILLNRVRDRAVVMRFVLFPVLLLSPAFYPLWQFRDNDAEYLHAISTANPFSHAVELIRYAAYGSVGVTELIIVAGCALAGFILAALLFGPERRINRR